MNGTLIGNHKWQIDTCRFLMTLSDPMSGFKIYLQVEYLRDKVTIEH